MWESTIKSLVNESVNKVLAVALRETRNEGEELAVTALVTGNTEKLGNGARVAVVGPGRNIAEAKYSDWVRLRKSLEKLRPPFSCVTNFFVVCRKDDRNEKYLGVIEVCLSKGIPFREVAPSWSEHEFWQEAFITSSLRIMQRVEKIQVPSSWLSLELKALEEISWEEKQFEEDPGMITALIQKEIMEKAGL
ncbi:D-AMINOACID AMINOTRANSFERASE-LIKE PLP-DEPENDENT ENZYMES SUPERFAMILY PROTEIN [Salix viminalis]|uniref:D-AMINOACID AMINOTRANSFERASE-LIKE PLP-DEPENDENT ENZYMES SUPERFAMILY PROTEIN n=1 Tax=Salix viminalis TaxID=40686 RepID=A0A9Q0TYV5_SALVM|nr:D-AMINOACID AMINOTRANSFERASE-LIKE PLP-DEPENDENT ENZYMES SUPERFAMILY PROTEIN [Salix viminalis]